MIHLWDAHLYVEGQLVDQFEDMDCPPDKIEDLVSIFPMFRDRSFGTEHDRVAGAIWVYEPNDRPGLPQPDFPVATVLYHPARSLLEN